MCGIVGYVGKRSAQDVLLDGLEKLEYRGYDSAGVALALDGGIRVVKSKGRLTALREKLAAQQLAQSFCGIGHTRWATHGEPSDVNSHPHSTPRVSIVHNGIIENYGLLKERLAAKGYTFQSETDTEVLVKLIDSCYTGDPLRALQCIAVPQPTRCTRPIPRSTSSVSSGMRSTGSPSSTRGHRECGGQLHCTCRRLCNVHLRRAGDRGSIHQGVYGSVNSSTLAPRLRVSLALEMVFSYTCFWVASAITGTPSVIRLMVPCFSSPAA